MKKLSLFFILSFDHLSVWGGLNFEKYFPIYRDSKPILIEDLQQFEFCKIKTAKQFFGLIKGLSQYLQVENEKGVDHAMSCVREYQKIFEEVPLCSAKKFIHAFESVFCVHDNFKKHVLVNSALIDPEHRMEVNSMRVFLKTISQNCKCIEIKKIVQSDDLRKFFRRNLNNFSKHCMRINNKYRSAWDLADACMKAGSIYDNGCFDLLFFIEQNINS